MHIVFMVEEESAEKFLEVIVPVMLGNHVSKEIHVFQGKTDLMNQLPARLRAYARWLPEDWRIVVLTDRDSEDCRQLKHRMESIALNAGLRSRSNPGEGGHFQVLNRIVVEELEAWYFGDAQAIGQAYAGVPATLDRKAKFRDPDAIMGGTWEALERVLQRAGYHRGGLAKIKAAQDISGFMAPERNRSKSFNVFRDGLLDLVGIEKN